MKYTIEEEDLTQIDYTTYYLKTVIGIVSFLVIYFESL